MLLVKKFYDAMLGRVILKVGIDQPASHLISINGWDCQTYDPAGGCMCLSLRKPLSSLITDCTVWTYLSRDEGFYL